MIDHSAFLVVVLAAATSGSATIANYHIRGDVRHPDGTPAVGAKVECRSCCDYEMVHAGQDAIARSDGGFELWWRTDRCECISCSASDYADLWLPTGYNYFMEAQNGTRSEVHLTRGSDPSPIPIVLGEQGGEMSFVVTDAKTREPRKASFVINKLPAATFPFAMSVATGTHGEHATQLLPAGDYTAQLTSFDCHGKELFVPPGSVGRSSFQVVAGIRRTLPLVFEFSAIEVLSPSAKTMRCSP